MGYFADEACCCRRLAEIEGHGDLCISVAAERLGVEFRQRCEIVHAQSDLTPTEASCEDAQSVNEGTYRMASTTRPFKTAVISLVFLLSAWSGHAVAQAGALATPSAYAGSALQAPVAIAKAQARERGVIQEWPNGGWESRTVMDSARWGHAVVSYSTESVPGFVYVIGGNNASGTTTSGVSRYDVDAGTWSDLTSMSNVLQQVSAVRIGQRIYVPGGYTTSFTPTALLQIYDIVADTWTTGASLPQAVGDYAIGVHDDRYIYIIGGYTGTADTDAVQVYDTETDTWAQATPKAGTLVAGLRGGIVEGRIVVTGGYNQAGSIQMSETWIGAIDPNDPTSITWTAGPNYPAGPVGRHGAGVPSTVSPGGEYSSHSVVVFTGGDPTGNGTESRAETWLFEVATESWHSLPAKLTAASNISSLVPILADGRVHMVAPGGYDGSSFLAVNEWLTLLGQSVFSDRFEQ